MKVGASDQSQAYHFATYFGAQIQRCRESNCRFENVAEIRPSSVPNSLRATNAQVPHRKMEALL